MVLRVQCRLDQQQACSPCGPASSGLGGWDLHLLGSLRVCRKSDSSTPASWASSSSGLVQKRAGRLARSLDEARPRVWGRASTHKQEVGWEARGEGVVASGRLAAGLQGRVRWRPSSLPEMGKKKVNGGSFLAANVGEKEGKYIWNWFSPALPRGSLRPHRRWLWLGTCALPVPCGCPPHPPAPLEQGLSSLLPAMVGALQPCPAYRQQPVRACAGTLSRCWAIFQMCQRGSCHPPATKSWRPCAQGAARAGRVWGRRAEREGGAETGVGG